MAEAARGGPPRLAMHLLRARLPADLRECLLGDLEEEYRRRASARAGRIRADLWFWYQTFSVRAGRLRRAARRMASVRPTWKSGGTSRPGLRRAERWGALLVRPGELTYAVRRLSRSPGFTAIAVVSLALGIGANTAIFSVVNAFLLRELPVADPGELVEIYTSEDDGYPYATSSYLDYLDMRARTDAFEGVVATRTFIARIDHAGQREVVFGELVSWDYFDVLGVRPALGRSFLPEEDETALTHPVALLGHRRWVSAFGRDPSVVGRTIYLNRRPYTVVGVLPEAYAGSLPVVVTDVFVPLQMTDAFMHSRFGSQLDRRTSRSMFVKGRLRDGVTVEQAGDALSALSTGLAEEYPDSNRDRVMTAVPAGDVALHPYVDRMLKPVAGLLLTVVGLVLLIACANLASFLLARAEDRRREIAVRLALGAGRGALVRQLLVETTLLAALGGGAGFVLAHWTLGLLARVQPPLPIPLHVNLSLDGTVMLFTCCVSVLAGLAFGLAPAWQATNPDVGPTLKDEGGGAGGRARSRLRGGLVVTQVAFSFVLLIGAGLFLRSLQKAQRIDPGFDTGPGAVIWPDLDLSGYETAEAGEAFYRAVRERLLAHPIITGVALADRLPLGAAVQTHGFVIPGQPSETPDGDHAVDNAHVSPSYFDVMAVPILRGRAFTEADVEGPPLLVVSEAFERRFFAGEGANGRTIEDAHGAPLRIIGVAADTKVRTLGEQPRPFVYQLEGQPYIESMQIVVRGEGTGSELLAAAQSGLRDVDSELVTLDARTMEEHLALLLFGPRIAALLLAVFGGLALLLSAIGIYGAVSYAVSRRTREVGIRMSVGATSTDVVGMVVRGGMGLVAIGGVIGVALAGAVTWSLSRYLYGVTGTDLVTFVSIPALLSGVALVAAYVPARRASTVDPVRALRSE